MIRTAECITPKHPDKICDRISDAILDKCLSQDPLSRVAVETCGGHGKVFVTGEVTTNAHIGDIENIVALEAVREMTHHLNVKILMYAPVIYLKAVGELKTKPVQHAVKEAMKSGLHPHALCLMCDKKPEESEMNKIELFTAVPKDNIVWHSKPDLDDCGKRLASILYK